MLRSANVPHDCIYGVLGMVNEKEIPIDLQPDYTIHLAWFFKGIQDILLNKLTAFWLWDFYHERLKGFPSWVPDFRDNMDIVAKELKTTTAVSFSSDGQDMTVQGALWDVYYRTFLHLAQKLSKSISRLLRKLF
jgi:hypothetical protein